MVADTVPCNVTPDGIADGNAWYAERQETEVVTTHMPSGTELPFVPPSVFSDIPPHDEKRMQSVKTAAAKTGLYINVCFFIFYLAVTVPIVTVPFVNVAEEAVYMTSCDVCPVKVSFERVLFVIDAFTASVPSNLPPYKSIPPP